ncbi:hypothetical protein LR48_Vigan221s002700 [Vigna angularis]|uniref:Uncharacterized protein n=1 Tax=Phaseolus angularis TaxID=3914 RepID=A0A0L9T647_PHAAN|nr:hypothetical protein LR48_Vigan221s002700 [Vigna angularis]
MCTFQIPSTFFIAMLDVSLQPYPSILGLPTLLLFPFIPCLQPRDRRVWLCEQRRRHSVSLAAATALTGSREDASRRNENASSLAREEAEKKGRAEAWRGNRWGLWRRSAHWWRPGRALLDFPPFHLESAFQFTRPQKQSIHDTIIHEDDDMAEAEDDPLSKLMTKLPRLKKAPLELYWDLRVFGLPPHVPVYITFSDALEVIGGDKMLNISIIQLWWMYMDTIVVDQGRSSMYGFVEPQTMQPSGAQLQSIHRGQVATAEMIVGMYDKPPALRWTMDEFHNVVAWPEEPVHGGGAGAAEASARDNEEDEAEEEDAFDEDEDEEEEEDTEDSSD